MSKKTVKQAKVHKVMHEFKSGGLHSGSKSGPEVTSRKQAVAIALSEGRKAEKGGYKRGGSRKSVHSHGDVGSTKAHGAFKYHD